MHLVRGHGEMGRGRYLLERKFDGNRLEMVAWGWVFNLSKRGEHMCAGGRQQVNVRVEVVTPHPCVTDLFHRLSFGKSPTPQCQRTGSCLLCTVEQALLNRHLDTRDQPLPCPLRPSQHGEQSWRPKMTPTGFRYACNVSIGSCRGVPRYLRL